MPEWESPRLGDPAQIGRYRIVGRLGDGGQGVVYLAETDGGEQRAIKVLHARLAAGSEGRDRLLNEVRATSRVPLFCTAQIFDVDFDDDRPYVVSEYVPGKSLHHVVSRDGPLGGGALHRLAVATVTALAAMHKAGIVHRDLKPHNVLLGPDGARVVDFGIAQALEDAGAGRHGPVGTPPYIAPEQLRGDPVGPAADMFAWGVTMTFAATGRPAFTDADPAADRFRHGAADVTGVPQPLREVVARCLAMAPEQRLTAREAWDELLSVEPAEAPVDGTVPEEAPVPPATPTVDQPTESKPADAATQPSGERRRWRPGGRRGFVTVAAAAVAVLGIAAVTVTLRTVGDRADPQQGAPAPPPPPHLVVGSANFPENVLLGEIYAQALEAKGFKITRRLSAGIRETTYDLVKSGAISVMPEYNGALLTTSVDKNSKAETTDEINFQLNRKLPDQLEALESAPAENKDTVTVTRKTADQYDLTSIADLEDVAGEMVMGAPSEFEARPKGGIGLRRDYGVAFKDYQPFQTGDQSLMVELLKDNKIQAADLFTTDPAIKENKFVVLDDPKHLFSAQNVTPLIYRSAVNQAARDALNAVSAQLTTDDLLEMNRRMAARATPERVARDWLRSTGIVRG